MRAQTPAMLTHFLTATGALFALGALLCAADGNWPNMTLWLLGALFVDGIDGPLARHFKVKENAPQIDGQLLDLIIDYLTYVFIPAFALMRSGLLPESAAWIAAGAITFASALYFARDGMKTASQSFRGFPACWNMVVLTLLTLTPPLIISLPLILILTVAMFLNVEFVHPVRTRQWRMVSLGAMILWCVLIGAAAWQYFYLPLFAQVALSIISIYLLGVSAVQQLLRKR
ncbi:MAG: CDP-alcohol phosphatidyltransferase family protein [Paracoccaceae bacterium]